jgi:hypothetical protein
MNMILIRTTTVIIIFINNLLLLLLYALKRINQLILTNEFVNAHVNLCKEISDCNYFRFHGIKIRSFLHSHFKRSFIK